MPKSDDTRNDVGRTSKRPECLRCKHYYVTWNPKFPYGCRAFGFQSRITPCLEVYSASQQQCLKFESRNKAVE